jgi:hypothetical protein
MPEQKREASDALLQAEREAGGIEADLRASA